MAYSEITSDFIQIANGEVPSRVPFFTISQEFDARYYGVTYEEYLASSDTMFRAQAKAIREFDYDWALYQVHDCLEFEPLGVPITYAGSNILPGMAAGLPMTQETLDNLAIPNFSAWPRILVFLEAIQKTRQEFGDDILVTGRIASPFTSTVFLYGIDETMLALVDEEKEDVLRKTIDFFSDLQYAFACEQAELGAHAVWFGDCLSSSKLISLNMHNNWVFDSNCTINSKLQDQGLFIFDEPADDKPEFMKVYADENIDVINVGIALDMAEAKKELHGLVGLIGNLDAIRYLQNGTPEEVEQEVARIVEIGKQGGGYAFCTDSVPRDATYENMKAMADTVRRCGTY